MNDWGGFRGWVQKSENHSSVGSWIVSESKFYPSALTEIRLRVDMVGILAVLVVLLMKSRRRGGGHDLDASERETVRERERESVREPVREARIERVKDDS